MDLSTATLTELIRALQGVRVRAAEVAEYVVARHDEHGDVFGAYVEFDAARIRAQATASDEALAQPGSGGALTGVPISIKDLYGVPGWGTRAGSPVGLPEAWTRAGPVVQSLLRQRAIVSGKTHTVEFAFGGIGANQHWGTPRNPWDADVHRVPGGSSSGAAVSLAEGSAWLALGTDTAGSVRIPASWTGQVGLKTTAGRWSIDGIVPLSHTLDTAGLLARSVEDLRWGFAAIEGESGDPRSEVPAPPTAAGLRLGVIEGALFEGCDPGVVEAVQDALRQLEGAHVTVLPAAMPEVDEALALFMRGSVAAVELWAFLRRELPAWIETLEPRVRQRVENAEAMPAREYLDRLATLQRLARSVGPRFSGFDALVVPTVANTPPPAADLEDVEAYKQANLLALRNTSVANTLGLCALTLPVGKDACGMPVGMMMLGPAGADPRLVEVARAVEGVLGTGGERLGRPPVGV